MAERQQVEDALKYLYDATANGQPVTAANLASVMGVPASRDDGPLALLLAAALVQEDEGRLVLTAQGREYALQVIRAHRLYETYLAHRTGHPTNTWHDQAHAAEHELSRAEVERLAISLGNPAYDPHGDPIPSATGIMPPQRGESLATRGVGWAGRVVHVEDEPPELYRVLSRAGLAPDVRLRVDAVGPRGVTLRVDGESHTIDLRAAAQVLTDHLAADETFDDTVMRLCEVKIGERAEVVGISPLIRGLARSRLLDLGVVPGTVLEIDMIGPSGDPVAYRIRGASIALRREQSERIVVRRRDGEAA
ncbi:MAG: FeoA domain-containing protein [Armatimonadetes bacterium]|nr:FeoA domain-containing protein [Armatimonadota bacterium]